MGKIIDKLRNKKQSWIRGKGLEVAKNIGDVAQQLTVLAALHGDPQSTAIAIQQMSESSIDSLEAANEIDKEKQNKSKQVNEKNQIRKSDLGKDSIKSKLEKKGATKGGIDKSKLKNENKILEKKIKEKNLKVSKIQ